MEDVDWNQLSDDFFQQQFSPDQELIHDHLPPLIEFDQFSPDQKLIYDHLPPVIEFDEARARKKASRRRYYLRKKMDPEWWEKEKIRKRLSARKHKLNPENPGSIAYIERNRERARQRGLKIKNNYYLREEYRRKRKEYDLKIKNDPLLHEEFLRKRREYYRRTKLNNPVVYQNILQNRRKRYQDKKK